MKIYKKHIINNFLKLLLLISSIFFILVLLLNLFEELNFFKDTNESLFYPLLLNVLNAPSILVNIFPFIFLLSTQFLLIDLIEKRSKIYSKAMFKIECENLKKSEIVNKVINIYEQN